MKHLLIGLTALALGTQATAGSYRVVLQPVDGKLITGHAGVQAVDETTSTAHVRLISPGNEVANRGTVRVLVRNLGATPFVFGPDNVTLRLSDGTELVPTPLDKFEKGAELVEREMRHEAAVRMQVDNSLSSYAQGERGGSAVPGDNIRTERVAGLQDRADVLGDSDLPGSQTRDALYQLLLPEPVGPNQAWGGYYVFDLPKTVFNRKADQPLTVIVRTGSEEHRFAATLHWK